MKIAAFDLGGKTGVADNLTNPAGFSRLWELQGANRAQRLCYFKLMLEGFFQESSEPYDVVIFERPFARGRAATRALWGYAGVLEAMATAYGCAVVDVTPSELKMFATGAGTADKLAMIAAAQIFGYDGENEHEADAVCVLRYGEFKCVREAPKPVKEKSVSAPEVPRQRRKRAAKSEVAPSARSNPKPRKSSAVDAGQRGARKGARKKVARKKSRRG